MPLGDFTGGELVIPRRRIGIAFERGDLLLFDAEQLHGNLPIAGKRVSPSALLCSQDSRLRSTAALAVTSEKTLAGN